MARSIIPRSSFSWSQREMFGRQNKKKTVFDKGNPAKLYSLLECLGEGTYGTVWTGKQNQTGVTCAVKIVTIDDDLEEIEQEIAIMKDANSPYIVKFFGAYWGEKEKIWMVMEHCVAGSINDLMYVCDITLNMEQVRTTSAAIALGLKYLHKHFIIHRDIKAGNVLLTDKGHIRLADFGVSAKLRKSSDRTTTAIGAPFWMAPEVIQEIPYDGRADVWSLGITVIELIEGRPPNSHMNAMKALFIIPQQQPPRLKDQKLPTDIHSFVKCCLTKQMKKRPNSKMILQHPFVKNEAKKIEVNDGQSEIMRNLVLKSLERIHKWRKDDDEDSEPSIEEPIEKTLARQNRNTTESSMGELDKDTIDTDSLDSLPDDNKYPKGPVSMMSETHPLSAPTEVAAPLPIQPPNFLNPAKDYNLRKSTKLEPVRDTHAPNENRFAKNNQKNMNDEGVIGLLSDDNGVGGGVMTKDFISLLKSIFRNNPDYFGNKAPKNWTGQDITLALVNTMNDILNTGENDEPNTSAVLMSGQFTSQSEAKQDQDLIDFMEGGNGFLLGRDGDNLPPPPPLNLATLEAPDVSDDDDDLNLL